MYLYIFLCMRHATLKARRKRWPLLTHIGWKKADEMAIVSSTSSSWACHFLSDPVRQVAADIPCDLLLILRTAQDKKAKKMAPRTFFEHLGLDQFPVPRTKNGRTAKKRGGSLLCIRRHASAPFHASTDRTRGRTLPFVIRAK